MVGDDPNSSAPEEHEDTFYEDLLNVVASPTNPNLLDMPFNDIPPSLALPTPSMEVNETQLLNELNLDIPTNDDEFDGLSFMDDSFTISLDMFDEPSNNDLNENIDHNVTTEQIGNDNGDNNVGDETIRVEVTTRVVGVPNGPNFEFGAASTMPIRNFEFGGASTMPIPDTQTPNRVSLCSCCNLLREIVHSNGYETFRLEIYGGIGFCCHAILHTLPFGNPMESQYQTSNLKDSTMEQVKNFIEQYCSHRVERGLFLIQDSNAAFYQAMNANSVQNPSGDDVPMASNVPDQTSNDPSVPLQNEGPSTSTPKERTRRQTPLSLQRERTGKLTLKDISMHFHLPIEEAAKKMSLCPTVLKKICRKGGLSRWPHRKIKSLQRRISALQILLETAEHPEVKATAEAEIDRMQREINQICDEAVNNTKSN